MERINPSSSARRLANLSDTRFFISDQIMWITNGLTNLCFLDDFRRKPHRAQYSFKKATEVNSKVTKTAPERT